MKMQFLKELSQTSQDSFELDSDSSKSRDDRLNSPKSGIFCFYFSSEASINLSAPYCVIAMGVIILPFSFALLLIAPRYTRASTVSLIMLLELVLGSFWVWIVVDEQPSFQMIIGASIVMISIITYIRISDTKKIISK